MTAILLLASCQYEKQQDEQIIEVDRIKVSEVDPAGQPEDFNSRQPVGDPIGDEMPERKLGEFMTVIPEGATEWPNGSPFPPEFLDIVAKLEAGESISEDDAITFRGFDSKWRNWKRIEEMGNSQKD